MKTIKKLLLCFFIIGISTSTNAQFWKKLKKKAQEKVSKVEDKIIDKLDKKTDKTIEASVDTIFEAPKKNKRKEPNFDAQKIISQMGNATYEAKYVFPVTATIVVEDVTTDIKKITMKQGYSKEALLIEMETNGDPMILDMKNQSAIMLNINSGTAQVMSLGWMEKMMGNQSSSNDEETDVTPVVKKTGNTKVINGYTCYEYNITFDGGKINAWYAPDVKFEYQDYLRGMAKVFSKKKEENPMQLLNTDYGYVMEMTFYNKQSEKQNTMKVIALNEKVRMIDMKRFKIQKL